MRYRDAVRLAARHGACEVALQQLRRLRSWDEFFIHPRQGEWRAWWIVTGLPVPTRRGWWGTDRLPSPDEETEWQVRHAVALRIPTDRLYSVPTPAEEPASVVRIVVAERIQPERIAGVPDHEPCEYVRSVIEWRIGTRQGD